jgi:hypothetical protein
VLIADLYPQHTLKTYIARSTSCRSSRLIQDFRDTKHRPSGTVLFATLCYRATTSLSPIHSRMDAGLAPRRGRGSICRQLDGALIDEDVNVLLADGRSVRALEFDVLPHPKDFTDLEHAIVFLTVEFLKAEDIGFRYMPEAGLRGIDYSRMSELSVSNVKALAGYIVTDIGKLPRGDAQPPLGPVSLKQNSEYARHGRH